MNVRPLLHWLAAAACVALAAGCGTSPSARYYTLSAPAEPAREAAGFAVAVGPVSIPAVVDRPEIVVTVGENEVWPDEFNRWASPLADAIGMRGRREPGRAAAHAARRAPRADGARRPGLPRRRRRAEVRDGARQPRARRRRVRGAADEGRRRGKRPRDPAGSRSPTGATTRSPPRTAGRWPAFPATSRSRSTASRRGPARAARPLLRHDDYRHPCVCARRGRRPAGRSGRPPRAPLPSAPVTTP